MSTLLEKTRILLSPRATGRGSLRWGFISAFLGLLGTILVYFNLVLPQSRLPAFNAAWGVTVVILLLLGVERYDVAQEAPARRVGIVLVLIRIALVEAAVSVDISGISSILYPVIPFAAFFTVGRGISYLLSLLAWILALGHIWFNHPGWYLELGSVNQVLMVTLMLIFMQGIAYLLDRNETNQEQTRKLLAELAASHRRLQIYAEQVGELSVADERNRLARDIHDTLGHHLTAINIQLEKALAFRDLNPSEAFQALCNAKQSSREALTDVRRSVSALRSAAAAFSLNQTLTELVNGMGKNNFTMDLRIEGEESGYAHPVLLTLYRVAQEGLTNIQKYAQAQSVFLSVEFGPQEAHLVLRDDGIGFDTGKLEMYAASNTRRFGLQGIRERLELVRGQMKVQSAPDQGTELVVSVPKNPARLVIGGV